MRFTWDEQNIKWFLDASFYTGFHQTLAQKLTKYIWPGSALCDVGCGLGRLDLELAPYVKNITAIDINKTAIGVLKRDANALQLTNLHARASDAKLLTGSFDVLLMSFFGRPNMPDTGKLHARRIIRIVNADDSSNFYPERHKCLEKETIPDVKDELEAQGTEYTLDIATIEFGQPLRTRREAVAFVLRNAPDAADKEVRGFIEKNLVNTGRNDFPFYLPKRKEIGIFIIDTEAKS